MLQTKPCDPPPSASLLTIPASSLVSPFHSLWLVPSFPPPSFSVFLVCLNPPPLFLHFFPDRLPFFCWPHAFPSLPTISPFF